MKVLEEMITQILDAVELVWDMPHGTKATIQTLRDSQTARSKLKGPTHEHLIVDMLGAHALMAVAQDVDVRRDVREQIEGLEERIRELESK